jgi:pseudouridylate synthase
VLVMQPPPADAALPRELVDTAVHEALEQARRQGIRGAATTPFLLGAVVAATGGRSIATNLALLEHNAMLAAQVAMALGLQSRTDAGSIELPGARVVE